MHQQGKKDAEKPTDPYPSNTVSVRIAEDAGAAYSYYIVNKEGIFPNGL